MEDLNKENISKANLNKHTTNQSEYISIFRYMFSPIFLAIVVTLLPLKLLIKHFYKKVSFWLFKRKSGQKSKLKNPENK